MNYGKFIGAKIDDIAKENNVSSTADIYEHIITNSGAESLSEFQSRVYAEFQKIQAENT